MKNRYILWLASLAILVVGFLVYWLATTEHELATSEATPRFAPEENRAEGATQFRALQAKQAARPSPQDGAAGGPQKIDGNTRTQLLRAIGEAIAKRQQQQKEQATAGSSAQQAAPEAPQEGSLKADYIRQQIKEIVPLVKECYDMALEENSRLGGELVVKFTIIGDEDHGGLVTDSQVMSEKTSQPSPILVECIRETMYALQLKAPKGGGSVVVKYPFRFTPSQEGNSQEGNSQEGNSQEGNSQEGNSQEGNSQEGNSQEGNNQPKNARPASPEARPAAAEKIP